MEGAPRLPHNPAKRGDTGGGRKGPTERRDNDEEREGEEVKHTMGGGGESGQFELKGTGNLGR